MIDFDETIDLVAELSALTFFPTDDAGRLAVARLVGEMASDMEQVRWLIRRMTSGIYDKWIGPREMRACFCSRYQPRDGHNECSAVFSDNQFPLDPTAPKRIAAPEMIALPPGNHVTADHELEEAITRAAKRKRLLARAGRSRSIDTGALETSVTAPQDRKPIPAPTPQIITQADFDREKQLILAARRTPISQSGEKTPICPK